MKKTERHWENAICVVSGLVAGLLTEIPGSSAVVERGFVVYSNLAKQQMLSVPEAALARCRQIIKDWPLLESRMSVDEQGRPLR